MRTIALAFIVFAACAVPAAADDLVDSILGVDPTLRWRSGQGAAYERSFGPDRSEPTYEFESLPADETDLYEGLRSPLFDRPEIEGLPEEQEESTALDETDVPELDAIPGNLEPQFDTEEIPAF